MDIESLVQEKIKQKQLAKIAKSENRRVKITADEITDPTVLGSGAIASMINVPGDEKAIAAAAKGVKETVAQVKSGNLEDLEEILVNQVYVLNTLFCDLAVKGKGRLFDPEVLRSLPDHPKTMLNMALKAQSQCRATIQAINDLKNPKKPSQFIKNYVDKQLNDVKLEVFQEIEDLNDGSPKLDRGTEATTIPTHPDLEAVGIINGTTNGTGKSESFSEFSQARNEE